MDKTRADNGLKVNAARAGVALAVLCCAAFTLSPAVTGLFAIVFGACAVTTPRSRSVAIETLAGLAFMMVMFGPAGAGGFALMQALTLLPLAVGLRGVRPVMALTIATAVAGVTAAVAAAFLPDLLPTRWLAFAPMAPAFALAAAAFILRRMAGGERLDALGPLLIALVVGAGLDGLHGAAVGWAAAQLAIPLAVMALSSRGSSRGSLAMGVLAAGFMTALATGAALGFAGASPLAAGPAVAFGLIAGMVALRVHAPTVARRLGRAFWVRPAQAARRPGVA